MRFLFAALRRWLCKHEPARNRIGGFRCVLCGLAGASLSDFGFDGFVDPQRVQFSREATQNARKRIA